VFESGFVSVVLAYDYSEIDESSLSAVMETQEKQGVGEKTNHMPPKLVVRPNAMHRSLELEMIITHGSSMPTPKPRTGREGR
jgi:hypothetical protein